MGRGGRQSNGAGCGLCGYFRGVLVLCFQIIHLKTQEDDSWKVREPFSPTIMSSGATYLSVCLPLRPAVPAHSCREAINKENAELLLVTVWILGSGVFFSKQISCFYAPRCLLS